MHTSARRVTPIFSSLPLPAAAKSALLVDFPRSRVGVLAEYGGGGRGSSTAGRRLLVVPLRDNDVPLRESEALGGV